MATLLSLADIETALLTERPRRRFIIPDVLPAGPCLLFGASGSGKTGICVRTAVAIAAGLQWGNKAVTQGCVLYVAGEDYHGVQERLVAAARHLGTTPADLPMAIMEPHRAGLVDIDCRNDIQLAAGELKRKYGLPVTLVVIDTLAACFGPKSQDDATAASEYMNNVDKIARELGCTVLSIHHTGKNEGSGMRGSQVFFDRADAVIKVSRGGERTSFLHVDKMRNGAGGDRFAFDIGSTALQTIDGPISVQVVHGLRELEAETASVDESKAKREQSMADQAFGILQRIAISGQASNEDWRTACFDAWSGKKPSALRKAFSTSRTKLLQEGFISTNGGTVTVTAISEKVTQSVTPEPESVSVTVTTPLSLERGRSNALTGHEHPSQEQNSSDGEAGNARSNGSNGRTSSFLRGAGGETPAMNGRAAGNGNAHGEKVIDEVIDMITGTPLDTGTYLAKIKRLPPNEQVIAARRDLAISRQAGKPKLQGGLAR